MEPPIDPGMQQAPQPGPTLPPSAPPAYTTAVQVPSFQQPPSLGEQIIPTKNPMALAGYYTGVFSLIPCLGLIVGPIALVLGTLAFKALRQNPMLPGKGHAIAALVTGGISTLLNWGTVILLVIAAIAARQ